MSGTIGGQSSHWPHDYVAGSLITPLTGDLTWPYGYGYIAM